MSIDSVMTHSFGRYYAAIKNRVYGFYLLQTLASEVPSASEDSTASRFSIVVAVHDSPEVTSQCIDSLERFATGAEVVLVDDGSSLESTKILLDAARIRNPQWFFLRNAQALGHSGSCNAGAEIASREFLLLLNSDAMIAGGLFSKIASCFDADRQVAVIGPSTSWCAGSQCNSLGRWLRHKLTSGQVYSFAKLAESRADATPVRKEFLSGFAFFIRTSVWRELNGFRQDVPDYGNEAELCKRIAKAGYLLNWLPSVYVHHFGQQSYGKANRDHRVKMQEYVNSLHRDTE